MSYRTPTQISTFVDENQYRMDVPAQFYGDEPNSYGERAGGSKRWDATEVRGIIFACWAYEQAAGNQAIPLVYKLINELGDEFLCDRSYFPSTPRDLRVLERAGIPIFGVEHRHQLADHDVVGTSISYPLLSINFVKQLMMSDIPPTWDDRINHETGQTIAGRHREPEKWPFVIVGGQGFGAPEVLANIADAIFCGEAEDEEGRPGVGALFERVRDLKRVGMWSTNRMECYRRLAVEFDFLYFPCFVDIHYAYEDRPSVTFAKHVAGEEGDAEPSKQVVGYTSKLPGMRLPVTKRFVKDLDNVPMLDNPPMLYEDPGQGVGDFEVQRGCPAWCSFCALTYRQKPYRQRSVEATTAFGSRLAKNTGTISLSPFGPDFPMHTQKKRLIKDLLENVTDDVNGSSMRVDDFIADPSYILLQAHGGMDTVTLGVEGNSQRMRDLVGKGAADEDVKEAVTRGIRAGIKKFKLYMISNLPGEDEGDIYRILNLAKEIADIRDSLGSNARIQFSWTPMLIEGNTPFQWFAPTTNAVALGDVWEELRDIKIYFKLGGKVQRDRLLYFQLTQRASREVGKAMVEAVADLNQGSWGGVPRGMSEMIDKRLKYHGFRNGILDSYDERQKNDMFGWEFIDQGVNVELMWVTYQQMREFLESTDSATYDEQFDDDYHGNEWIERCDTKCYGKTCGVCDVTDLQIRRNYIQGAAQEVSVDLNDVKVLDQKSMVMKVRARVVKAEDKRFVMNDHWRYAVRRAAYLADVPITKRSVRFSSDALKWKDFTSGVDFLEFGLTRKVTQGELDELMAEFNRKLGSSMSVSYAEIHPATSDEIRGEVDLNLFEMELDVDPVEAVEALKRWAEASYVKMVFKEESRMAGASREEVNGKEYVDDLWLVREGHRVKLRMLTRGKASPYIVYQAVFGRHSWIEAARYPANRLEAFVESDGASYDFFRPVCDECGENVPVNVLNRPWHASLCPRCQDEVEGRVIAVVRSGG